MKNERTFLLGCAAVVVILSGCAAEYQPMEAVLRMEVPKQVVVTLDCSKTMEARVEAAHFDEVDSEFWKFSSRFASDCEGREGRVEKQLFLVHIEKTGVPEANWPYDRNVYQVKWPDVTYRMRSKHLKPVGAEDLLALAATHPELYRTDVIVAVGSVAPTGIPGDYAAPFVAMQGPDGTTKTLGVGGANQVWHDQDVSGTMWHVYFLAEYDMER